MQNATLKKITQKIILFFNSVRCSWREIFSVTFLMRFYKTRQTGSRSGFI